MMRRSLRGWWVDDPCTVGRRGFLQTAAAATAAAAVGCGRPGRWRVLEDTLVPTLAAACDRIVPPDDHPGASQAGVVEFIDRQLATGQREKLAAWQAALRALDATARLQSGVPFRQLRAPDQDRLLESVEAGQVDPTLWAEVDAAVFFRELVSFTMMGYYGDPRHGGNRNRASWRMLGLPDPPIRGRQPAEAGPDAG